MANYKYNDELGLAADKPFNMAILFLTRLNDRLNDANLYRVQGNLIACFRSLRCVYAIIHFKIKQKGHEKEEEELNTEFQKAENFFYTPVTRNRSDTLQLQSNAITKIEKILDNLEVKLGDLVYEYGLLMPPEKEKRDPHKAIKDVFRN